MFIHTSHLHLCSVYEGGVYPVHDEGLQLLVLLNRGAPLIAPPQLLSLSTRVPAAQFPSPIDKHETKVVNFTLHLLQLRLGKVNYVLFTYDHLMSVMLRSQHFIKFIYLALKGFVQNMIHVL